MYRLTSGVIAAMANITDFLDAARTVLGWRAGLVRAAPAPFPPAEALTSTVVPAVSTQRDYGDETDREAAAIPDSPTLPVIEGSKLSALLREGVERGDFRLGEGGDIIPVIPTLGVVNTTWVKVLMKELIIATGQDSKVNKV